MCQCSQELPVDFKHQLVNVLPEIKQQASWDADATLGGSSNDTALFMFHSRFSFELDC